MLILAEILFCGESGKQLDKRDDATIGVAFLARATRIMDPRRRGLQLYRPFGIQGRGRYGTHRGVGGYELPILSGRRPPDH